MICTCNGVIAELAEYGDCRQTDAYLLPDGTLLLRTSPEPFPINPTDPSPRIKVRRIHHWFDEHSRYGVLVVLPGNWIADRDLVQAGSS